jgi:hypothetical protein
MLIPGPLIPGRLRRRSAGMPRSPRPSPSRERAGWRPPNSEFYNHQKRAQRGPSPRAPEPHRMEPPSSNLSNLSQIGIGPWRQHDTAVERARYCTTLQDGLAAKGTLARSRRSKKVLEGSRELRIIWAHPDLDPDPDPDPDPDLDPVRVLLTLLSFGL